MEQINIEDIMKQIRTEIREKGYVDNELQFSDIACLAGGSGVPFDMNQYKEEVESANESRLVLSYRDISSDRAGVGKIITIVKKIVRKVVCFYIEPIVDDQNRFNEFSTRIMTQSVSRFEEDDQKIDELEKKLYDCEKKIRELESVIKNMHQS